MCWLPSAMARRGRRAVTDLDSHILHIYDLTSAVVPADSSGASGDGRVTLDPPGMPLAVDIALGQRSDEPRY